LNRVVRVRLHGFTLIELMLVLLLIGILAVAVMPRFFDRKTYDTRAYFDQTEALLRYAQKAAIAENRAIYVRLNGSSVALCYDAACSTPLPPATGSNSGSSATKVACTIGGSYRSGWACEAPPSGVTLSAAAMFYFSPLGKPYLASDTPPASTFSPLALTVAGDVNRSIQVEAETGYVH